MRMNEETREQINLRSVNGGANIMNGNERSKIIKTNVWQRHLKEDITVNWYRY